MQHRVELAGREVCRVLERLEDGRIEIVAQIGDTFAPIVETEPEPVRGDDTRIGDVKNGRGDDSHVPSPRVRWGRVGVSEASPVPVTPEIRL